MAAAQREAEKRELLEFIRDRYHLLQGRHSSTLTTEDKNRKWKEIFDMCKARGHKWTIGKDDKFLRQTKWPGIKREVNVSDLF